MKRIAAGAHLLSPWLFEPAKRPDNRAYYCLGSSFLSWCEHKVFFFTVEWTLLYLGIIKIKSHKKSDFPVQGALPGSEWFVTTDELTGSGHVCEVTCGGREFKAFPSFFSNTDFLLTYTRASPNGGEREMTACHFPVWIAIFVATRKDNGLCKA